jgi:PAS domain S-box-containing protein
MADPLRRVEAAAVLAAIGDAVVVCEASGAIVEWNLAAERIFGYTRAEALGRSLDIIIPDRLQKRHWDGYHETMRTGVTKYGADLLKVPATGKDGKSLSIAFTVALIAGSDGKTAFIASVIRDETARFAQERATQKRVTELEAQIAKLRA